MNSVVWQHIPESLHPIAFSIGFFSVHWYALFFFAGFVAAMMFVLWLRKKESLPYSEEDLYDVFFAVFIGAYIGARLWYVIFYHADIFLQDPLRIILPYDLSYGTWTGISGMSFHGGLIGAACGLFWFVRKKEISFWPLADTLVLAAPIALFFGRLGNFFNRELYGRITEMPWGMYFPGVWPEGVLRHPATLYEALLEGVVLFVWLVYVKYRRPFPGALVCAYLTGYALLRFVAEYFREPDVQIGLFFGILSLGQIFSLGMFAIGAGIFLWFKRKNHDTMERQERNM